MSLFELVLDLVGWRRWGHGRRAEPGVRVQRRGPALREAEFSLPVLPGAQSLGLCLAVRATSTSTLRSLPAVVQDSPVVPLWNSLGSPNLV
ncbi:hypothetical protein SKAU_G00133240 [Synaphobranchus kaupii]|uniref:Uncharacterized protein n=1 Tax=Synaphobranchus kaupii TaxID=118154 RepID=A0A9Q1FRT9_SYNKA|nr:hypothetical protein SKAU_G00133240 [Synaphobranchus kaupii]